MGIYTHMTFKEQCDECGQWTPNCHGYEGQVLCEKCIAKHEEEKNNENQNQEIEQGSSDSNEGVS